MSFSSTKYYPIVLIPDGILDLYKTGVSEDDVPEFDEPLNLIYTYPPKQPNAWGTESYRVFNFKGAVFNVLTHVMLGVLSCFWSISYLLLELGAVMLFSFLQLSIFEGENTIPVVVSLIVYLIIAIGIFPSDHEWWIIKTRERDLTEEEIKEQDRLYEIRKQEYGVKKILAEKQNAIIKMQHYQKCSTWNHDEVIRLILEGCRPHVKAKSAENAIKKGRSENYFEDCLRSVFGDKIHANQITEDYIFYPDLVYVCNETGIHIDIEIDEPYILSSREPIHYKHDEDENRNEYFIRNNWCVIRFTEEQVVEHTETCIEYIKEFVNHFKLGTFMQSNGSFEFPVENHGSEYEFYTKKWSEKKAKKLAKRNYREGYLGPAGLL